MGGAYMREPVKYFAFNKKTDFLRGASYNIKFLSPGIGIDDPDKGKGIFFSRLLDSGEKKTKWHRLLVDKASYTESSIRFYIFSSDSRYLEYEGREYEIGSLLTDMSIDYELKHTMLEPFMVRSCLDPEDLLLFDVEGRYLWFEIEFAPHHNSLPEIYRIKLFFPKDTWMKYLPEVYQINSKSASFVERFLGLYQTLYQDMTNRINSFAGYFDPNRVDEEVLRWLAGWLSIEDNYVWDADKLRYLVSNAMNLYRIRGTTEYLRRMVALYTGRESFIIEYHHIEPFLADDARSELLTQLYGDNIYIFTVIVDMEAGIGINEYKILTKIIENAKPAHMECSLIVLEPFIFLDRYSYLGINSILGSYQALVLDGQSSVSFTTIS